MGALELRFVFCGLSHSMHADVLHSTFLLCSMILSSNVVCSGAQVVDHVVSVLVFEFLCSSCSLRSVPLASLVFVQFFFLTCFWCQLKRRLT